jgi:hypothetical protein
MRIAFALVAFAFALSCTPPGDKSKDAGKTEAPAAVKDAGVKDKPAPKADAGKADKEKPAPMKKG